MHRHPFRLECITCIHATEPHTGDPGASWPLTPGRVHEGVVHFCTGPGARGTNATMRRTLSEPEYGRTQAAMAQAKLLFAGRYPGNPYRLAGKPCPRGISGNTD